MPQDRAGSAQQQRPVGEHSRTSALHLPAEPWRLTCAGVRRALSSLGVLWVLRVGILPLLDARQEVRLRDGSICVSKRDSERSPCPRGRERLSDLRPPTSLAAGDDG